MRQGGGLSDVGGAMKGADARVGGGMRGDDGPAVVGGGVVVDEEVEGGVGLGKDGAKLLGDEAGAVVGGEEDGTSCLTTPRHCRHELSFNCDLAVTVLPTLDDQSTQNPTSFCLFASQLPTCDTHQLPCASRLSL